MDEEPQSQMDVAKWEYLQKRLVEIIKAAEEKLELALHRVHAVHHVDILVQEAAANFGKAIDEQRTALLDKYLFGEKFDVLEAIKCFETFCSEQVKRR